MIYVQFAFLREGTSDEPLADHIENLLIEAGADEAVQQVRDYKGSTREKLEAFLREDLPVDVIFVHRDTDGAGHVAREEEIFGAARDLNSCPPIVPVTPATMTEAWLLTSEKEIRAVAGRPGGRARLDLPTVQHIEDMADPKKKLKEALSAASELSGRHLHEFSTWKSFSAQRRILFNRLDTDGPVRQLTSFRRLLDDLTAFVGRDPRSQPREG